MEELRGAAFVCATEVYGCRRVGQGIRRGGKWWNDKVRIAVVQKRKLFEQWLQQRKEQAFDECREEWKQQLEKQRERQKIGL